jgi:hypothetical protein
MGRNAFGEKHSRLVVLGAIAYSISFVILFSIGASIPMQLQSTFQASNTAADLPTRLNNVIYSYLIAVVVIGLILNLATVGFTYAIQNRVGKSLLWMSFGISVLLLIPAFVLISGLSQAISTSVASNDPSSLYTFVGQAEAFRLLGIIPAIFFAIAYLNARGRIGNGEIPEMLLPQQSV